MLFSQAPHGSHAIHTPPLFTYLQNPAPPLHMVVAPGGNALVARTRAWHVGFFLFRYLPLLLILLFISLSSLLQNPQMPHSLCVCVCECVPAVGTSGTGRLHQPFHMRPQVHGCPLPGCILLSTKKAAEQHNNNYSNNGQCKGIGNLTQDTYLSISLRNRTEPVVVVVVIGRCRGGGGGRRRRRPFSPNVSLTVSLSPTCRAPTKTKKNPQRGVAPLCLQSLSTSRVYAAAMFV